GRSCDRRRIRDCAEHLCASPADQPRQGRAGQVVGARPDRLDRCHHGRRQGREASARRAAADRLYPVQGGSGKPARRRLFPGRPRGSAISYAGAGRAEDRGRAGEFHRPRQALEVHGTLRGNFPRSVPVGSLIESLDGSAFRLRKPYSGLILRSVSVGAGRLKRVSKDGGSPCPALTCTYCDAPTTATTREPPALASRHASWSTMLAPTTATPRNAVP